MKGARLIQIVVIALILMFWIALFNLDALTQAAPDISGKNQENPPGQDGYLMTFHACDTTADDCFDPRNHWVYLAQSLDGMNWNLFPDWKPYHGSVPDVIRRNETIYIYTPGHLVRYHLDTQTIEGPLEVKVPGLTTGYVDPSLIIDENGYLVLFFLYGQQGMDPAGCAPDEATCVREIGSASEIPGSDGAEFSLDDGQRVSANIDNASQIKTFSDPDVFYDGAQYVLYISHG
jgi:hypothetical protein